MKVLKHEGVGPELAGAAGERVHQAYGRNYQLPNTTAHSETCANIGNVLWNWRMFRATGEARFMDVVELALYNSVLSLPQLGKCSQCDSPALPHRVCPSCGFYKGRQVINVEATA